jgi:hypothetical protein
MKHFLQSLIVGLIFISVYGSAQVGFNKVGYINSNLPTDSWVYNSVVIDSNNKILVVGYTDNGDGLIIRYLLNGVLDAESNWNTKNFREIAKILQLE